MAVLNLKKKKKYKIQIEEIFEVVKGNRTVSNFQKYDKSITLKDYWITFIICLFITFTYSNFIYQNLWISIGLSLGVTIFYTNYVMLLQKKKAYNNHVRKQINLYMALLSQMVSANQTLLNALMMIAPNIQTPVRDDIYEVIREIELEGYPYDALDKFSNKYYKDTYLKMFHDQLKLTYRQGGNEEILNDVVNEHSSLEVSMDEYSKNKKYYKQYTYIFMGYLVGLPLMFMFFQREWYANYVTSIFGLVINTIIYIITLAISISVEKKYLDDTLIEF